MDNLFIGLMVFLACLGLGRAGLRLARVTPDGVFEEAALSAGFGFGTVALLVFILGFFKFLYPAVFVALIAGILLLFLRFSRQILRKLGGEMAAGFRGAGFLAKFALCLAVAAALLSLCGVLAPPTGQDELCYHLTQPKNYVRAHAIYEVPYSVNSLWPYLGEMLFTLGLLLKGPETAKFFHFSFYILTALLVYAFTARFLSRKGAFWAAVFYALIPAAYMQASFAYIDHILAFYFLAAFYCALVFLENRQAAWAFLGGLFCGLCLSTKLIGLFCIPAVLSVVLADAFFGKNRKNLLTGAFLFAAGTLLFGSVFYLRSWILRGNPVFPFYPNFFGGHGWVDRTYVDAHGTGKGVLDYFLILWNVTMHPDRFGGEHVGSLLLAFFPLSFICVKWLRGYSYALIGLGFLTLPWFMVDPNIRFWFGGLALLSVIGGASAAALLELNGLWFRLSLRTLLVVFLAVSASFAAYHFRDEVKLLFNNNREGYLLDHERTYGVARAVNSMLRPADTVFSHNEIHGYYFNAPLVLSGDLELFTHYQEEKMTPAELAAYFRKLGFTYVLAREIKDSSDNFLPGPASDGFKSEAVFHSHGLRYVLYRINYEG